MRKIKLTQGKYALVDDEDYEYLNQWKWHYSQGRATRIIWHGSKPDRRGDHVMMHRLLNKTPDGYDTDHINRNPLDNRKSNLRTTTHSENLHNRPKQSNNTSGYKGVSFDKETGKWRAFIKYPDKWHNLGRFEKKSDAIKARKLAGWSQ